MLDEIDKSKSKQPDKSQPSYPIDFVVAQQLEECVVRLSNLTKLDSGEFRFQMQPKEDVDLRVVEVTTPYARYVRITGELRLSRWQGTSTRIQGDLCYTTTRSRLQESGGSLRVIGIFTFALVLFALIGRTYVPAEGLVVPALAMGIFIVAFILDHPLMTRWISAVRTDDCRRHLERVLQSVLSP